MSCISSVSFFVLLNGATTPFFILGRGLRQGFSLPLLIFPLVFEGLSRLLKELEGNDSIKGVPIDITCNITHLLFVDNILFFCEGIRRIIEKLKGIMELFCKSTRMVINMEKYIMTLWGIYE